MEANEANKGRREKGRHVGQVIVYHALITSLEEACKLVLFINEQGTRILHYTVGYGAPSVSVSCAKRATDIILVTCNAQGIFAKDPKCKIAPYAKASLPSFTIKLVQDYLFTAT